MPERCSQTVREARHEDPSFLAATLGPVFNLRAVGVAATALLPRWPHYSGVFGWRADGRVHSRKGAGDVACVAHLTEK